MTIFGGIGAALSNRNYCIYWAGNGFNTVGRWMYRIAVGWLAWELTESTSWLGIVAFVETFPMVIFSILAGAIADRTGYLRITILSQIATVVVAAIFAGVTLAGGITIELVVLFAFLIGSLEALTTPARMAIVHALVPKDHLASAIALNSATFNVARFLGPMIAGGLLTVVSTGAVLAIVAASFTQFCIVLLRVRTNEPVRTPGPLRNFFRDIWSGMRYGLGHPGIRFLLIMLGATGFLVRPVIELMPGFSAQVFDRGPEGLSILMSSLGIGATVGGLWLARRGRTGGLTTIVTYGLLVQGLALVLAAYAGSIWLAAAFLGGVGFAIVLGGIGSQTLIQNTVDSQMRARVMSLFIVISWGLPAVGALLGGWVASFIGLPATFAIGAAATVLLWLWARPHGRTLGPELEQSDSPGSDKT
ncbi:MAG: MFS transporter [Rhodospirillaceae bacterium]